MALEFKVETLEGLPEHIQGLYKRDGDVFVLQVAGVEPVEAIQGLKNAKDREKERAKTAEQELAELRAKADVERQALERKNLEEQNRNAELADSYKSEVEVLKKQIADDNAKRIEDSRQAKARELGAKFGSNEDNSDILSLVFERMLQTNEGGDVVGEGGLEIDVMIQNMESSGKYASLFKGTGSTGGGANGGSQNPAAKTLGEMTATEEAAFANSNPEQYAQMIKGH